MVDCGYRQFEQEDKMSANQTRPFFQNKTEFRLSAASAILFFISSLAGIVLTSRVYLTGDLVTGLLPNDIANLVIGLPYLLVTMGLALRDQVWARLCWPGALLYIVYNSLIAVLSLPPGLLAAVHLVLLALCLACLWLIFRQYAPILMSGKPAGIRFELMTGILLVVMGIFFLGRAASIIANPPTDARWGSVEFAVSLSDLLISPIWITAGILLLLGRPFGRPLAAAGVAQLIALFIGLLVVMLIKPILTGIHFSTADFVVVLMMSLFIIIPGIVFIAALHKSAGGTA